MHSFMLQCHAKITVKRILQYGTVVEGEASEAEVGGERGREVVGWEGQHIMQIAYLWKCTITSAQPPLGYSSCWYCGD